MTKTNQSVMVEKNCTIEHEGHKFESGGAVVTPDAIVAYPKENGVLGGHEYGHNLNPNQK